MAATHSLSACTMAVEGCGCSAEAGATMETAATTLALPDFVLVALDLGRGRYVEGFAQAVNVRRETFLTAP